MKSYLDIITCKRIENHIVRIAEATYHWLCYVQNITDSNVIAESAIKYPFVECLERIGFDNIHLEAYHPVFPNRRMDIFCGDVATESNTGITNERAKLYVEFKYVSPYTRNKKEQQRIYNDIMRLCAFKTKSPQTHCYFLICGNTVIFNDCFMNIMQPAKTKPTMLERTLSEGKALKPTGVYADFFSFDEKNRSKDFPIDSEYYDKFCKEYGFESIKKGTVIKTNLISLFPKNDRLQSPQTLAIWEVVSDSEVINNLNNVQYVNPSIKEYLCSLFQRKRTHNESSNLSR